MEQSGFQNRLRIFTDLDGVKPLFSVALIGFTAVTSQIILLREFLIAFYGNEISLGFIFVGWFIAGMLGSWLLGGFADRIKSKIAFFSTCQFLLAILLFLSIFAVRAIKPALNLIPGEVIPLTPMFISSFLILLPLCSLMGFMFALGAKICGINATYILEAVGSICGGLLASFILIRFFDSLQIMLFLSLLNILAAIFLRRSFVFFIAFACLIFLILSGGLNSLQQSSLKIGWKGYELLASENSIYGNISVTKREEQRSFFYNGLHLYTIPDPQASEEAVHFALLEHPDPKKVLLVGAGISGLIEEALKEPINNVDYVELDPLIINLAKNYLPENESASLQDKRVSIKNLDGRRFIKETERKYDCIIMHLGDPYTAQLNRYYTVEFFREAKSRLNQGGILCFALTSSESYISRELKEFLRPVYLSIRQVFADTMVIPGNTAYFLACDEEGVLTYDYKILVERAGQRNLDLKYVAEYYLFNRLSQEKINFMENALKPDRTTQINYDFRPIAYYYNMIFWSAHFRDSFFKTALQAVNAQRIWISLSVLCAFLLLFALLKRKSIKKQASIIAVTVIGFTQMSFQLVILLSFQVIYGYVFYKLALIITCFMLGLAAGGFWILKRAPKIKNEINLFIKTQSAVCVYLLIFPALTHSPSGLNWILPLISIISGFIAGAQFLLANKIYLKDREEVGRVAGLTYGMDLFGSCLGAFLTSVFLIPVLGISQTCFLALAVNFTVLIILFVALFSKNT